MYSLMIKQNIHIVDFTILYEVLNEIKNNFLFQLFNHNNESDFSKYLSSENFDQINSLIIIKPQNKKLFNLNSLDKKIILDISDPPLTINKLIEKINIHLIKQRYGYQSNINLKNYSIDLNSRTIFKENIDLKLTEKEINIILFLNKKQKPQKVGILQNEVWGYSSGLETHTVETHIYRLRKKIKDAFNDDTFIVSHNDGYQI
jgi:hypothetical protein